MAQQQRRGRRGSNRPRRPMDWEYFRIGGGVTGNTEGAAWVVLPLDMRTFYTDPTLMASRVVLSVRNRDLITTPTYFGLGLIVWTAEDDTIPPSPTVPSVLDAGDLDWVLRLIFMWPTNTPAGTVYTTGNGRDVVLSEAMRRLGNDKSILMAIQAIGGSVDYAADIRCLIKE